MKEKVYCDICGRVNYITPRAKYDLEKGNWLIYCKDCADKIHISEKEAKEQLIKIYKF